VAETGVIRTPDQRVRVFVSSTLRELAPERQAVRDAVTRLRLVPVMFELGARPHPPRQVYHDYLAQSQVFVGVYWQSYGWVAPGESTSGLEDEYLLSAGLPRLIYVKSPSPRREPRLAEMLNRIEDEAGISYRQFSDAAELEGLVENDLAVLLSDRFEIARLRDLAGAAVEEEASPAPVLPVPATPLIGREQETAAVEDLVVKEGVRLVTLTGPGGIGKSRLAVEAAQRLEPRFRDGVRFAGLSSAPAAGVADAIAAALPLNTWGANLSSDVKSYLRTRRLLLVLDNFEQALGAAPLVAELLGAAPGLVVLVTSRTVLRLSGEHEFPVSTLAVPETGAPDAEVAEQYPAVRLFAERAHAVAPGFELTLANAAAVAEICRRLDGLPLAIELAAARVKLLPPQALLARLGDPMSLLTGGARDLPVRQQTLKNTLDWSFGLLSAGEQRLFARLGVFAGPFDLSAVQAVGDPVGAADEAGPGQAGQVMDALGSLVNNSMVQPWAGDGEPRFRLLGTIREYALERLHDNDTDWREAHDRHAAYYAALAEPAEAELQGSGQLAWLRRLEAEHGNLAAMMSWLIDQDPPEQAVQLAWATWRFWWLHGHADEMTRFSKRVLANSAHLALHQRALGLGFGAFESLVGGDYDQAQVLFEQSLPLFRQAGDKLRTAVTTAVLGRLLVLQHQDASASDLLDQSQTLLRDLDTYEFTGSDRVQQLLDVAYVHNFLGEIRLSQGDDQAAARLFTQAVTVARRAPDRVTILISLYNLAISSRALGDLSGAAAYLTEGLSLAAEAGDETSVAYYLEGLAVMATPEDNPQRAVHLLAAANALFEAHGSGWLHAFLLRNTRGDEALAALRARLGGEAFEAAYAYGRSIAGRRAVEYALNSGQASMPGREAAKPGSA
jgi:predicted ATPase